MTVASARLTERQRQIKERLDAGMQARQIAEDLGITRNAIYQQIQAMRRKGVLDANFTPGGAPRREAMTPTSVDGDAAPMLLVQVMNELITTQRELAQIANRLGNLIG